MSSEIVFSRELVRTTNLWWPPELIDVEIAHIIRRAWLRAEIDEDEGGMLLVEFARLPLERFPHAPLIARIWQLRHNLSAYDAAYVALAESLDATLITRDRQPAQARRGDRQGGQRRRQADARMARSSGHEARIEYVE